MEKWKGKVAVVTGANAGIGSAIAEALVNAGLKVAGLARRKEKLEEIAKKLQNRTGRFYPIIADVTKEEEILTAFKWVKENLGPIHILINNAGVGKCELLLEGDTESWRKILETNVLAFAVTTREAVKDMRANDIDGHIVYMNSLFGHRVPGFGKTNLYPASKFAVKALAESLRQEFNSIGSKIKITNISPGVVDTDIWENSGFTCDVDFKDQLKKIPKLLPEDVADAVIYSLSTPPHVQIHEMIIQSVGEIF